MIRALCVLAPLALLSAGCPPKDSAPSVPMPVEPAPGWTEADGPIAGPRNIVEGAPDAPIAPDTPGAGPWPPYLTVIRKAVGERHNPCVEEASAAASAPAMVVVTISAAGAVTEAVLTRSSGSEPFDQCLQRALRGLQLAPPPAELLVDGQLVSKEIAFR